jgi:hypothetical protein
MTDRADQLRQLITDAIATTFPDEVPTRFLLLTESIDDHGDPILRILTSTGMPEWDRLGMIEYARQIEQVATIAKVNPDDFD